MTEIPRTPDIFGPGVGAAFRMEDVDLKDMFNKAIAELDADGTYKTIEAKYFKIRHTRQVARSSARTRGWDGSPCCSARGGGCPCC